MILYISMIILGFVMMEFVAWSNHKYIMHSFLWRWHKDHHTRDREKVTLKELGKTEANRFEKNDLFFVLYAFPAILLMITGLSFNKLTLVFFSIGITLYGAVYFLIHDVVIHRRLPLPCLQNSSNKYLQAVIKAHLAHHRPKSRRDFYNYGLLIFPSKYFND